MKRAFFIATATAIIAALAVVVLPGTAMAATCTSTGFYRDGINLTAKQMGGNVTGSLDATGCNIGVYYDSTTTPGNVTGANISGANYYGVFVKGTSVRVTGSSIHDIGESPLNGSQHGVAIYFATVVTGTAPDIDGNVIQPACTVGTTTATISGNTISSYQKSGIVANCTGTTATIRNNTVTGEGPVPYIAQNGVQVGFGAKATVTSNTVTGNAYTGANNASSGGILAVGGPCYGSDNAVGLSITKNTLTGNDVGVWIFNAAADCVTAPSTATNNAVKINKISNGAVTNTTGLTVTPPCGYQAGIASNGKKDLIVNNTINGPGYTPQVPDCDPSAAVPAFLRSIDTSGKVRGLPSNK